jgi:hypothetical protein
VQALDFVQPLLDDGQVGEGQLQVEQLDVALGVHAALGVRHVLVGEGAHYVEQAVGLAEVGQEGAAELVLGRRGDVDVLHLGGHPALGLEHLVQPLQPRVGHLGHAHVGAGGGVGADVRLAPGEGVEQRSLAAPRQPDYPYLHFFVSTVCVSFKNVNRSVFSYPQHGFPLRA